MDLYTLLENAINELTPYQKDLLIKRHFLERIKRQANQIQKDIDLDYARSEDNKPYKVR